jgi:phenylacetate-CoA ligase
MDELTLECEPTGGDVDRGELANRIEHVLKESTGVRIVVAVLDPGAVPRSEGKAVRVIDRRT